MRAIFVLPAALLGALQACVNRPPPKPAPVTVTVAPAAVAASPPTVVTEPNAVEPECASATDCHPVNACGVFAEGDCGPDSEPVQSADQGCPDAVPTSHCDCIEGRCLGVP